MGRCLLPEASRPWLTACFQVLVFVVRRTAARDSSFRFTADRERFCKSRLLVRCVLGRYLDLDPKAVVFVQGLNGKPLIDDLRGSGIQFNLTHCQSVALIAVTVGQSIGIDVED